eukprot:10572014-Karenia_brevis.AAC.1
MASTFSQQTARLAYPAIPEFPVRKKSSSLVNSPLRACTGALDLSRNFHPTYSTRVTGKTSFARDDPYQQAAPSPPISPFWASSLISPSTCPAFGWE